MDSITKLAKRAKLTKKEEVFFVSLAPFASFVIESDRPVCTNRAHFPQIMVAQKPLLKPLVL